MLEAERRLARGYDVMAACDLPKVDAWVRFPLPAEVGTLYTTNR